MPVFPESTNKQSPEKPFPVFWGGPDRPPRYLRDLLEERINAVPPGGEILWITYYFRDEGLAETLLLARRRGVKVRVVMEGNPRTSAVNNKVRKTLAAEDALGQDLRAVSHRMIDNRFFRKCRLHEKLYYFSHPVPSALVGTFNPSGNLPEDPVVIRKIGDQDRGHNVLVEILEPALSMGLHEHALRMFQMTHGPWERYMSESNRVISSGVTRILFFPRSQRKDFDSLLEGLGKGHSLRIAVSHLNDAGICKRLFNLAVLGVQIEVLAHDTQRRVPSWVEKQMLESGITFIRYVHPEGLPMHNKFMLIDTPEQQIVAVGSMNLSVRSLHANHELLMISENADLYSTFRQRWDELLLQAKSFGQERSGP